MDAEGGVYRSLSVPFSLFTFFPNVLSEFLRFPYFLRFPCLGRMKKRQRIDFFHSKSAKNFEELGDRAELGLGRLFAGGRAGKRRGRAGFFGNRQGATSRAAVDACGAGSVLGACSERASRDGVRRSESASFVTHKCDEQSQRSGGVGVFLELRHDCLSRASGWDLLPGLSRRLATSHKPGNARTQL